MFPTTAPRFLDKESVRKFASTYGVEASYDGNDRTMYFKGVRAQECIDSINQMEGTTTAFKMAVSKK